MGITKIGWLIRIGGAVLVLAVIAFLRYENHQLQANLTAVNQQLGAANQREVQLVNTNAQMKQTVKQLKLSAEQERKAANQVEQQRQHWQQVAKQAQIQIKEAIADEDCVDRRIPHVDEWMYYPNTNPRRHAVSN